MANFFPDDQRTSAPFFDAKRRLHRGNQNFEVTLGIDCFWVAKNWWQNNQNQTRT